MKSGTTVATSCVGTFVKHAFAPVPLDFAGGHSFRRVSSGFTPFVG
jgi:hypothetical protein